MLTRLKPRIKALAASTVFAYGPEDFVARLRKCGVLPGATLVVHSSWLAHNGFRGKPSDMVRALKSAVGNDGLLVMTSMPYHNMSSAEWLARNKLLDVRRTPSMMGLLSEAFRRSEGVVRSLSVTHPLLAWGSEAASFLAGHGDTDRPFGATSPFARMLERNALILGIDAPFATFTFTHFVEDMLAETLPVPLYEASMMSGRVVDQDGNEHVQTVRVLAAAANKARREHRLVERLLADGTLHTGRIGRTALTWLRAADVVQAAHTLVAEGRHFFDPPAHQE